MTFLRVGGLFSALRAPAALVRAAVGSTDPDTVAIRLAQELEGGPVIAAHSTTHFYFLMLPAAASTTGRVQGAEYLARGTLLGVPPLTVNASQEPGGSYWAVPMISPVRLCHAPWVMRLLERGRIGLDGGDER
ncbi:hypothetical protein [Streptomyces tendae]|uniref:hypothetical protein n=1 Tax=Streptomyces tendae TaxID=1932 RepID=UPI003414BD0B